jgi:hypothetical protein
VDKKSTQKRKTIGQWIAEKAMLLEPAPDWAVSLPTLKAQPGKGQLLPRLWSLFPWYSEMKGVVDALNGKELGSLLVSEGPGSTKHGDYEQKLRETPPILRKLVHDWWDSGPNLQKFSLANPTVRAHADSLWSRTPLELYWGDSANADV